MPSPAPDPGPAVVALLGAIGDRIRARRKALKVSVGTTAEAAGMSRVTLHRIERGEASVTMGAYLNAMSALGLEVAVTLKGPAADPAAPEAPASTRALPDRIVIADYPQLRRLAWSIPGAVDVSPQEALDLYERGWRHIAPDTMEPREHDLFTALVRVLAGGHLLV
jgi:transcriptional regulator with XRE-family HTH domain